MGCKKKTATSIQILWMKLHRPVRRMKKADLFFFFSFFLSLTTDLLRFLFDDTNKCFFAWAVFIHGILQSWDLLNETYFCFGEKFLVSLTCCIIWSRVIIENLNFHRNQRLTKFSVSRLWNFKFTFFKTNFYLSQQEKVC